MEIESELELTFLRNVSESFWLGARRNLADGKWYWDGSGKEVNFALRGLSPDKNLFGGGSSGTCAAFIKGSLNAIQCSLHTGVDTICEAASKHIGDNPPPPADPFPVREWREYKSDVTNSTYLFGEFPLPWMSAKRFCEEKEGFLAQVDTSRENEDLLNQLKSSNDTSTTRRWIGARDMGSLDWIWTKANTSLDLGFTDWKTSQSNGNEAQCLALSERDQSGYHWQREACLTWNRFICEIPSNESEVIEAADHLGDAQCQETAYNLDGYSVTVKNCFHFVKLQYDHRRAEEFCREKLGQSLAGVDMVGWRNFSSLIGDRSNDRQRVSSGKFLYT